MAQSQRESVGQIGRWLVDGVQLVDGGGGGGGG
jgi:hypothetical protein